MTNRDIQLERPGEDRFVHALELCSIFGYKGKASLNHLVDAGVIAKPRTVLCSDGRLRRGWLRPYVRRLIADPPTRLLAARIAMVADRLSATASPSAAAGGTAEPATGSDLRRRNRRRR